MGPASAEMREPVVTAMPPGLPSISSHSPVCTPALISIPRSCTLWATSIPQRIARAGPSNVA